MILFKYISKGGINMIKSLSDMLNQLKGQDKVILSVAAAEDKEVLIAIKDAVEKEIIKPILVGQAEKICTIAKEINFNLVDIKIINSETIEESAKIAVQLVSNKEADFVMKGLLDTAVLLKEVLNKDYGLRTDSLLSHVMIYELEKYHKLLLLTDGGMNIAPDYEQKEKILKNSIQAAKSLGIKTVKVACLAAKEKVNPKMQTTVDADLLQKACEGGKFGENVIVEGPLAFDLAVSKEASEIKGFKSEISGDVDILVVPTIEVGNGIGKAFTYMTNSKSAGIIMGAKAPIVLVSRADSHESKLYSIAYGALIAKNIK
jgi:phosphate butyryltransferase